MDMVKNTGGANPMDAVLDGAAIRTRDELHDALITSLALPEWYGRNLDALHDCLTEIGRETRLVIRNLAALRQTLGAYGDVFLQVLRDSAEENPAFRMELEEQEEI